MTNEIIRKIDDMIADLYTLKLWVVHNEYQKKDSSSNSEPQSGSEHASEPEENSLEEHPHIEQSKMSIIDLQSKAQAKACEGPVTEPRKVIHRRTNRSFPLNKSKNLNDEQRNKVLEYTKNNKELIMNQQPDTRNEFLQKLVRDNLNINLSSYMASKIITMLMI